jgi:hypothetical protein
MWEEIFRQEGVPFARVDLASAVGHSDYSMVVVNRGLSSIESKVLEHYIQQGGSVLGYAQHLLGVCGTTTIQERVDYLISDRDEILPDIHVMDLAVLGAIPREANVLRTQANHFAAFVGALMGGHAVLLPFDVESVLTDDRTATKCFYSPFDRLPSERVSLVGKGEVRHLLHRAFEYLHHVRDLPYVHLWYFPGAHKNLFAFRIDTDGSPQGDVDDLYNLARRNQVSLSWFLDVKSHESWLRNFASFVDQEIGAHCYNHQTFPTYDENLKDISRAVREIEEIGLKPAGFAAPYGFWNEELGRAIDDMRFLYSSEFSCAYDSLPLYPRTEGTWFRTVQIPIHPICIGSLMRVGYSDAQMKSYYEAVIVRKLSRSEPLFFYHHPTHRHWDVVERIFQSMGDLGIDNVTLGDYARWWKIREGLAPVVSFDHHLLQMTDDQPAREDITQEVSLHITNGNGREAVVPIERTIDLNAVEWKAVATLVPPPQDIQRIREFDPRAMLGEIYNTVVRKFR